MSPLEPPGAKRRDQAVFDKLVSSSVPVLRLFPRRSCRKARPRELARQQVSPAMRLSTCPAGVPLSESANEWTDVTWNPVTVCSVLSDSCTNS